MIQLRVRRLTSAEVSLELSEVCYNTDAIPSVGQTNRRYNEIKWQRWDAGSAPENDTYCYIDSAERHTCTSDNRGPRQEDHHDLRDAQITATEYDQEEFDHSSPRQQTTTTRQSAMFCVVCWRPVYHP